MPQSLRVWWIGTGLVAAMSVATVIGGFIYLSNANAELRSIVTAQQENADTLYDQLLEEGVQPEGEKPSEVKGTPGEPGAAGQAGPEGPRGPQGDEGKMGVPGATGPIGAQGVPGIPGQPGPEGVAGPAGPQGPAGETGAQGPAGATGPAGPQGPIGMSGAIESYTFELLGATYLCQINGTPPPYTYYCSLQPPI
jgi:hypothetical protein